MYYDLKKIVRLLSRIDLLVIHIKFILFVFYTCYLIKKWFIKNQ